MTRTIPRQVPVKQCDHRTFGICCSACRAGYVQYMDTASWDAELIERYIIWPALYDERGGES